MRQLPNLFTLLNLFFGCIAIVFVLQTGITVTSTPYGDKLVDIPEKIWMASLFVALAAIVDFLDGFVARALKATSPMGKELDSLADVVSFGVVPGMILYQFLRLSFAKEPNGLDTPFIALVPAFIIPCAAAYRLAKFNLDETQVFHFRGVPTPAIGLLVASLPLIYWFNNVGSVNSLLLNKWFDYALVLVLSYLMVSNLPVMSMKFERYDLKSNLPKIVLVIVALIAAVTLKWLAVPVVFIVYILLSVFMQRPSLRSV